MRIAGHQPDYLPYTGFFARMLMVDTFVLVDHVQFEKKSFQSRNRVAGNSGPVLLSVPVRSRGRFTQSIMDVEIAEPAGRWRTAHWRTLEHCYGKAKAFELHAPFFERLYQCGWKRLSDLNITIIEYLCCCFSIATPRRRSSVLGLTSRKTALIVDLCDAYGAKQYVSGPGGIAYVDDRKLEQAGLRSTYAWYEPVAYVRGGQPFIPDLSAVDLLFHVGDDAGGILRASVLGPPRAAAEVGRDWGTGRSGDEHLSFAHSEQRAN